MPQPERASSPAPGDSAAASSALLDVGRIRLLLGRSPHARALPADILERLARRGRIECFKDGRLINAAWQPVHKLWVVLTGGLRVTQVGEDGSALTVAVLGEGSYYGAGSLVGDGGRARSEAQAVGDTQLAVFDLARLNQEFAADERMTQHRMQLLHRRLLATMDLAGDVLAAPMPQRLARRLLSQALSAGRGPEIELRVSQADLATMLGASRSRVNAELGRLEAAGAVRLGYRMVVVRDLALLRAAAGAEVRPL